MERALSWWIVTRLHSRLENEIGKTAGASCVVSDLASFEACRKITHGVERLDAVVHLAGVYIDDDASEEFKDVWDTTIAANLTAVFNLTSVFAPLLCKAAPGRLIFTSSVAFRRGSRDHLAYSASKGGVVGLTRALARRFAPDVLVNAVAPGIIQTAMTADIRQTRSDALLAEIPCGAGERRLRSPVSCNSFVAMPAAISPVKSSMLMAA
jgi:3-oxoacyl-[acyl-carrier protein] reductase